MKRVEGRGLRAALAAGCWLAAAAAACGAERHSNRIGGGRWTDPAAWHGGGVPAATDTVVIASGDTVVFDGGEGDTPSCAALFVDPDGVLAFRADGGRHVLRAAGPVESYGIIRLDATRAEGGFMGLRLVAPAPADRVIRLMEGSALLVYGAPPGTGREGGVGLSAAWPADGAPGAGALSTVAQVTLDLHRADVSNLVVEASGIDNTGHKPGQRVNVVGCRFTGLSRLVLSQCDTALVQGNVFEGPEAPVGAPAAATFLHCALTDCRGNAVSRGYAVGIALHGGVDPSLTANTVTGVVTALSIVHAENAMIKGNDLRGKEAGVRLSNTTGVMEDTVLGGAAAAVLTDSTVQFTDVRVMDPPGGTGTVFLSNASVTLLNCNVGTNQIVRDARAPAGGPWAQAMSYLVVRVAGAAPAGTAVDVRTAKASGGPPPGMADLNVRNSPAPVGPGGLTPLPGTLAPLVVRSWTIERTGEFKAAPFYELRVAAPGKPAAGAGQVIEVKDDWYRADPAGAGPTLEVKAP